MSADRQPARIVVLGAGYVGLFAALRLQRKLRRDEGSVTVIDPQPNMTYQAFLPEAAAGSIEPRHVTVPLRSTLRRCDVRTARVVGVDPDERVVSVELPTGEIDSVGYDVLVVALGAITRMLPIPGLEERGIGLKTVEEVVHLRDRVLAKLEQASNARDPELRRRLLTFTVVGGGFAGVETVAELEDMTRAATELHPGVEPADLRWVLVEATGRILYEVRETLGQYTLDRLRARGVEVLLDTRVKSFEGGVAELEDGTGFATDTIVWTAGVRPNPALSGFHLPLDERDRLIVTPALRVSQRPEIWAAGDCAAVPDLSRTAGEPTATCPPNAQHAVRQGKRLADNVLASLRGKPVRDYAHKNAGSVASLGLGKGVADVYGIRGKGLFAWLMHRAYHVSAMPTFNRKARIVADWLSGGLFGRDIAALGRVMDYRAERTESPRTTAR